MPAEEKARYNQLAAEEESTNLTELQKTNKISNIFTKLRNNTSSKSKEASDAIERRKKEKHCRKRGRLASADKKEKQSDIQCRKRARVTSADEKNKQSDIQSSENASDAKIKSSKTKKAVRFENIFHNEQKDEKENECSTSSEGTLLKNSEKTTDGIVSLRRDNKKVGAGKVMKNFKMVHNYTLTNGWVAVSIISLCRDDVRCWAEYPTHSGKIEVNSFSAWPVDQIVDENDDEENINGIDGNDDVKGRESEASFQPAKPIVSTSAGQIVDENDDEENINGIDGNDDVKGRESEASFQPAKPIVSTPAGQIVDENDDEENLHGTDGNDDVKGRESEASFQLAKQIASTSAVYINLAPEGARVYDKTHSCFFCEKEYAKIARHLQQVHGEEKEVKDALQHPANHEKRKKQFEKLCRMGNFNHNMRVLELKKGELKVVRRPTANDEGSGNPENYLPCKYCHGFFLGDELW
ncbi:uncharacterized protein LOC114535339 [Dendronephthya gigantea]|uniref:uncharacterized protein LOC114535339 n=1 Tax=Dendronephthya gigantea TaxID=151771 RepID=UPI00106B0BF0|nr:uncharacterized protein LOC114535339 [Dendronephthya gigantea]